jgi:hypothetical protein
MVGAELVFDGKGRNKLALGHFEDFLGASGDLERTAMLVQDTLVLPVLRIHLSSVTDSVVAGVGFLHSWRTAIDVIVAISDISNTSLPGTSGPRGRMLSSLPGPRHIHRNYLK